MMPYPPPWMDAATLAEHICVSVSTIEAWVKQGILPPPRKPGGKRLWQWAEVEYWLKAGKWGTGEEAIRNATREAIQG